MRAVNRFETIVVTFVGVCALCVSTYTAYVQRQQVRAAVWPIVEFSSGNEPAIHFSVANKGVGPAIIRNVIVKVDNQPVKNWHELLERLAGAGNYRFSENDVGGHVFAPNELMDVLTVMDDNGKPLGDSSNPLWLKLNKERARVSVEICYSSTLGESWTLHASALSAGRTIPTSHCPETSAASFEQ